MWNVKFKCQNFNMQCLDLVDRVSWNVLSSTQDERELIKHPTNMPVKTIWCSIGRKSHRKESWTKKLRNTSWCILKFQCTSNSKLTAWNTLYINVQLLNWSKVACIDNWIMDKDINWDSTIQLFQWNRKPTKIREL